MKERSDSYNNSRIIIKKKEISDKEKDFTSTMKSENQSINATRLWTNEFRTACYETATICGTLVPTSMAVTGYLGLPAEMANILLRPPTHSVTRSLGSLLFGVPHTYMIALSLDTYLLRVIIVIYAPTTNVTSLICPNLLILRSC